MKRENHEKDIKLYKSIFYHYCRLVDQIVNKTDLKIDDVKQEKKIFRPVRGDKLPDEYLKYFQRAGISNDQIMLMAGGFFCSFKLLEIIYYKRLIERRLITPRHHLYYTETKNEKQAA